MYGRVDELVAMLIREWLFRRAKQRINGWMRTCMHEWLDPTDEPTNGLADRSMDESVSRYINTGEPTTESTQARYGMSWHGMVTNR